MANDSSAKKPTLIVFDLDFTLWPFYVHCEYAYPFRKDEHGSVVDANNKIINPYPQVTEILASLSNNGYKIGIASRTCDTPAAELLIELFGWNKYILNKQIYPGIKIKHFQSLHKETGFDYSELLFFDDQLYNISDTETLGVISILVAPEFGITKENIEKGLKKFSTEI